MGGVRMQSICSRLVCLVLALTACSAPARSKSEQVIEISTRDQKLNALLIVPSGAIGSVILLAGGHGNLSLGKDGKLGWGAGNQVVRTRAAYARAGFVTLVPDIAPDLKGNGGDVLPAYRWSGKHARDIGAAVKHLRGLKEPVYLVGTSRAALSIANAAVTLSGAEAPDAIVITSGMLVRISDKQPSAERDVGRLERIKQPTLIVYHAKDGCAHTPASSAPKVKALLSGAQRVDIKILSGGSAGSGNPCEARSHHGFEGQDGEVVNLITDWLKRLKSL